MKIEDNDNLFNGLLNFEILSDPNETVVELKSDPNRLFSPLPKKNNKKSSKRKSKTKKGDETEELSMLQSNESYIHSYDENNNALKSVVIEIDQTQNLINEELVKIRKSKTMSKKYDHMSSLVTTKSQLFGSKISAIKEIGNNITQSHNLELKRQKELNISEDNTDAQVVDLYKSFINTPRDTMPNFVNDQSMFQNPDRFTGVDVMQRTPEEMTPQQHMMLLENDPSVKMVVMYNQNTGQKWFDVVNISTGKSVPNVDLPDPMLLENLNIDLVNMTARDTKLELFYPVFLV